MTIVYHRDIQLDVTQVIELYKRSSLGARRPVDRPDIFSGMVKNSNLVITAWDETRLVGIARALTDFVYVTYLADLVVDEDYQRQGIGKQLIHEVQIHTQPECMMVLLAAPQANEYYPQLGFRHNPRAWMLNSDY